MVEDTPADDMDDFFGATVEEPQQNVFDVVVEEEQEIAPEDEKNTSKIAEIANKND